ncbi:TetR/AcrR family transcriptional regulator [Pseudonocardia eucalypti]|uniref:TetR/AcrR family transcriptional regulator n=1 Tax=Pseudonocardia eucalypti TaxID=648755 RepID=A0ABP9PYI1_9PSEU
MVTELGSEAPHSPRIARRRARTRERILDTAERAFGAGYRNVRVEDLAEAADVSIGTLYVHFGSKDGVYLALVERALEQMAAYLDRAYRPEYSPLEQVIAAGDVYLRFHLEHPGLFQFLAFDTVLGELPAEVREIQQRVGERLEEVIGGFQARIEAAVAAGQADHRYDARTTARFLWGAWNGVVSLGRREDRMALTDEEIAACLQLGRRLVRDGLTAPAHRDQDGYSLARIVSIDQPAS